MLRRGLRLMMRVQPVQMLLSTYLITVTDGLRHCSCAVERDQLLVGGGVTLDWSEFMGGYNTPDSPVKDGRSERVIK